jgi:hypothetical protein
MTSDRALEWMGIALSAATLIVIAATAVAAIIQLRHLRASNQLSALLEILDQWNQPTLQAAYSQFNLHMAAKLKDPEYVKLLQTRDSTDRTTHPEFLIFDLWEQVGTYAKHGLIDEEILLDIVSAQVENAWKRGLPVVDIVRSVRGPSVFENFEYLAVRAVRYARRYPNGSYPRGVPRMNDVKPQE